jgi:hypothetical protein
MQRFFSRLMTLSNGVEGFGLGCPSVINKTLLNKLGHLPILVEKPICCTQLLCDGCPLRLGGDSGAIARALTAVQNDMYTTGIMMQS